MHHPINRTSPSNPKSWAKMSKKTRSSLMVLYPTRRRPRTGGPGWEASPTRIPRNPYLVRIKGGLCLLPSTWNRLCRSTSNLSICGTLTNSGFLGSILPLDCLAISQSPRVDPPPSLGVGCLVLEVLLDVLMLLHAESPDGNSGCCNPRVITHEFDENETYSRI